MKRRRPKQRSGVFLGAYVPPALKQELKRWADEEGTNVAQLVQSILMAHELNTPQPKTDAAIIEQAHKYELLRNGLWHAARNGNALASTVAAALIRQYDIEGPEGEDPGEA